MPSASPSQSQSPARPHGGRRRIAVLVATAGLGLAACGGAPAETTADTGHDQRVAEAQDRATRARARAGDESGATGSEGEGSSEAGMTVENLDEGTEGAATDEDWPTALAYKEEAGSGEPTTGTGAKGAEATGSEAKGAEAKGAAAETATTGHGTATTAAEHGAPAAGEQPATTAAASTGVHWAYEGEAGPDHWAALQGLAACGGQRQSPIEVASRALPAKLSQVKLQWRPATVTLTDTGHTVQANVAPGSVTVIDGVPYNLVQVHYHRPSEHTVRGHQLPLEVHFVHKTEQGSIAVLAVLVETGAANPVLGTLFPAGRATGTASGVSLTSLLPTDLHTYRYLGSLTTPPCTEGVRWLVLGEPVAASEGQVGGLTYNHNARPTQPLGTRLVLTDQGW